MERCIGSQILINLSWVSACSFELCGPASMCDSQADSERRSGADVAVFARQYVLFPATWSPDTVQSIEWAGIAEQLVERVTSEECAREQAKVD
jgi:hypothetical protein